MKRLEREAIKTVKERKLYKNIEISMACKNKITSNILISNTAITLVALIITILFSYDEK